MNSSMLAGERRWASQRRGGMTVLGKVAVPKPINLPSQRLENHGLDPTVEIVPKGTVSWGSRSSSGSSPWTSLSLSPNADGGTVSPSHLTGRPSSGGSGTRPSTSGSDRTHDNVPNVWSANSRPSSASGTLSSNQTSSSVLRPRSAENRPNSSQLSRFADPVTKTSAAWGSSVTAERLGVKSMKEDNFSLSSGDFPTLGSEKDNSVKNVESEDCRPTSASGRIAQAKEDNIPHADIKHGTVNTWRAESNPHPEDDVHPPSMEKWQGDPPQYYNNNSAPQRFEGWRGPPMNGPTGSWYGGRPQGPPFGAHGPPGAFPMEPYPYYRPQMPPPPLAGSQPGPQSGPRGPHPKNGDLYRPQMHESYPRPGMQFRPNFYPGPPGPMPFEGYYGPPPPMGYINNERDIPYMGMAPGPPVYNGYPAPAPDMSNSHGRAGGRGPTGKMISEQVEAAHSEDTRGPKRVSTNIHNEYEKEEGGHWDQNVPPNVHPGKTWFTASSRKTEWGAEEDAEEAVLPKRMAPPVNSTSSYEDKIHSADSMKVKAFEGMSNAKGVDDNWTSKSEGPPSFPPVVPQLPVVSERDAVLPAPTKNSALIHKIDGLNAKFRVSDGWGDTVGDADDRGKERIGSQVADVKIYNNTREVVNASGSSHRTPVYRNSASASAPNEVTVPPLGDNPVQPISVAPRRSYHGGNPRVDHRGKGKFNNSQDADGWQRRPLSNDSSSAVRASNNEPKRNILAHGPNIVVEASENSIMDPVGKTEGDSAEVSDSADIQAQRAKMKELAKQRYLQLQREEEERVREQKAKALAKLEELDRRKLAGEAANQKAERTLIVGDIQPQKQESHTVIGTVIAELKTNESGFNIVLSPAVLTDSNTIQAKESVDAARDLHPVIQQKGFVESNAPPMPRKEESEDGSANKVVSEHDDGGTSRQKRAGYKQKQNNVSQKHMNEKVVSSSTFEVQKDHTHDPPSSDTRLSGPSAPSNTAVEPSAQQRKRMNRNNKPKPRPEETPIVSALPPVTSDITQGNVVLDNWGFAIETVPNVPGASVSTVSEPDGAVQTRDVTSSLPSEESQSKAHNQWKPHPSRRVPKNQQSHRFTDKHHGSDTVVWAPKAKGTEEASQHSVHESANSAKSTNMAQNSLKGKRAEMERYVPKPQLAQQGSAPTSSSSVATGEQSESAISENSQPLSSAPANVKSNLEINVGDSSHNKNKKDHGTWKQRGSTDSSQVKVGSSSTPEPTKEIQQSKELVQSERSEINRVNAETKVTSGNYMSADSTTAAVNRHPSVRDQGAAGRGRRHPPRGPRSSGNYPDSDNTLYGEVDGSSIQSSAMDVNHMDKSVVSKENRTSSHWQPKSSPNSANNQQGIRNAANESATSDTNKNPRKGYPQHKESGNSSQPQSQTGESLNIKSNVADDSVSRPYQDFDREKKPAPVKGRPYSPNQDQVTSRELPHTNTDDHFEHNVTSGSRRGGRHNSRPMRSHDPRGEWYSGHENRPHNAPTFRDNRQRQNVHMEYQPVAPFKGSKSEKVEELGDGGADSMEQRHRERGPNQAKRGGNFYRR